MTILLPENSSTQSTRRPENIYTLLAGKEDKTIWLKSLANEIGRCSIGLHKFHKPYAEISGHNTVFFIKPSQVPPGRKVTPTAILYVQQYNQIKLK